MARRILPIISRHHLVLTTLLTFDVLCNESLPIFLDMMVPSWAAVVFSVVVVLIVGEILPQAVCTGPN